MLDLKNCPFCGGKAELSVRGMTAVSRATDLKYYAVVNCPSCEASVCGEATDDEDEAQPLAIAAWNRRALQAVGPEPAVADENRRLRAVISKVCEALPNGAFCSPNCTIEFMEEVPSEVASVISALVATPPAETLPSPSSLSMSKGVITAAYDRDEDARRAYDILEGSATPPAGGDDWTVDDTLTAREILDYLGIGSDASLEPYADRRRDAVAKIIQKRIATTPPAEPVEEALDAQSSTSAYDRHQLAKLAFAIFYSVNFCAPQNIAALIKEVDTCGDDCEHSNGHYCYKEQRGEFCPFALVEDLRNISAALYGPLDPRGYLPAVFGPEKITAFNTAALATKPAVKNDETVVEALTPDIYSQAWRDQMDKMITDDMVILALDAVDPDWNDEFSKAKARSNSRNWMRKVLRVTIPIAAAALAAKDGRS